ncbi:MAG: LptF/LptG family permease [Candidatus Latescibacteria bacterium]|nr:LptF/LptG family permease [Candidatus Latescibacterota bacterium]
MTTLSRYILRQHLGPFCFGLTLIVFVLMIDAVLQVMDQVLSKGVTLGLAGQLFLYNLAWILALAVPMAVLIAALMAFGRLSVDHEIIAAKASGVGFLQLARPVLGVASLLTVLMVLFNDRVLPDWNHRARNLSADLQRRKAALVLKQKEGSFIHGLGSYSLLVHHVDQEANLLQGITVLDSGGQGPPPTLRAASGELGLFDEGRYIRLTLNEGEFLRFDEGDPRRLIRGTFARQVVHVEDPQRALTPYQSSFRSDREMDLAALYLAAREQRQRQQSARRLMDSTLQVFIASLDTAGTDSAGQLAQRVQQAEKFIQKQWNLWDHSGQAADSYWVEIHKKFSIPFACVVFVLLGAPLGALLRRRGAAVSVGISLAFFWNYWMFLIGGEELADRGLLSPALSMWAPNLVFGALGLYLLYCAALDRPLWRRSAR